MQRGFVVNNLLYRNAIDVAFVYRKQRQAHFGDRQRCILFLFHEFRYALAAFELPPRCRIKVRGKLCERRKLTILSKRETYTATELLDYLRLCRTADSRYRQARIDRRANTGIEEIGLQEDLTIGNGNHVGRYERRNITSLCLNDRQSGE